MEKCKRSRLIKPAVCCRWSKDTPSFLGTGEATTATYGYICIIKATVVRVMEDWYRHIVG